MTQPGKINRRPYIVVFILLGILTALEVGVTRIPIAKGLMAFLLISMALTKAALVALVFMHLGHERRALKLTVALPFAFPAIYAFILIADATWRYLK
jgi:caa(3)-type oxidase subunit IV